MLGTGSLKGFISHLVKFCFYVKQIKYLLYKLIKFLQSTQNSSSPCRPHEPGDKVQESEPRYFMEAPLIPREKVWSSDRAGGWVRLGAGLALMVKTKFPVLSLLEFSKLTAWAAAANIVGTNISTGDYYFEHWL